MGENWQDRLDMAFELQALGIESIPINALMPIPGTPLAERQPLAGEEILRTIAIFCYAALMWMFEIIPAWATSVTTIVFLLLSV